MGARLRTSIYKKILQRYNYIACATIARAKHRKNNNKIDHQATDKKYHLNEAIRDIERSVENSTHLFIPKYPGKSIILVLKAAKYKNLSY